MVPGDLMLTPPPDAKKKGNSHALTRDPEGDDARDHGSRPLRGAPARARSRPVSVIPFADDSSANSGPMAAFHCR